MKNIIFTLIAIFTISLGYSQDSKAYLGVSLGMAIPGGDVGEDLKTGLDLGFINFGYRFSEKWGATLNLVSSGHEVEDTDGDMAIGIAYWGIGPMYTTSVTDKISWDIKPQLALGMAGKVSLSDDYGDFAEIEEDLTYKGSGFVIGNSFVFGTDTGFKVSVNLDYLFGSFTEVEYDGISADIDDDNGFSKLSLGVGVRYNF